MFKLLLSILGGAILLLLGIAAALTIFIHRFRPTAPGATIGFSANIITAPIVFLPMLLLFTIGSAATFLLLRHR